MSATTEIARRLGLHRAGRDWRGNCPACGYFALSLTERAGRALWHCAACADQAALARLLRDAGALPERRPDAAPAARPDAAERTERAVRIWNGAEAIAPGTPAALYLARRMIEHVIGSAALRWRADVPHPAGGRRLALIARIDGVDGDLQAVQRIFLKPDGTKADCEPQKASVGPMAGGAIRLQPCSAELAITEGLESAAAAGLLLGAPAWAAISCGNMEKSMILPATVRLITICADHDAPGLRAAEDAARRWRDEGRAVRIIRARKVGADAADILAGGAP